MTYWILTTEYPPFYGGGISTYCRHTALMLAGRAHKVTIFINDNAVPNTDIREEGNIRVVRFNPSQTNSASFLGHTTNLSYEFAHIVKQFISKEGKPDLIEAQEYMGIAYFLLQFKRLLYDWCKDVPVLITMHSPSQVHMEYNHVPQYRYPNYWICEMERFCLQAADQIISPSRYMIRELEKRFNLSNKNLTIIPNPFRWEIGNVDTIPGKNPDEIVFFGKLTAQKGAFELLSYFKTLWDKGYSKPLYLIGGQDIVYHPEGISMGDLIRKKYAGYIEQKLLKLEGGIRPAEIAKRLSKAAVVVIPSKNDNLPYAVMEMMSLGKIVLVSKQGGQSEIVEHGVNGFVFDHNVPGSFSTELEYILKLTPEKRKAISLKAVQKIEDHYGYKVVYDAKSILVESLLKRVEPASRQFPFVRPLTDSPGGREEKIPGSRNLSVVIPYYNMGEYIGDTIESIKNTSFPESEIIIVNDGSTEKNSLLKLEGYRHDPGIKIIDSVNQGLASARNLGAAAATGNYLAFLDADDKVLPDYYNSAINVLSHYENVHFVGSWTQYFGNGVGVWPTFTPEPPLILFHNLVNSSSLVYKRDSFLEGGKNDHHMPFQGWEDYESVISMTSKGLSGVVLPELLFHYRVRPNSMFRAISKTKAILLSQYISNKHKDYFAAFATDIINLATANGPGTLLNNPTLDLHLADQMPFASKVSLKLIRLIKKNRHVKRIAHKLYSFTKK